jgi:subtilase family serine protease
LPTGFQILGGVFNGFTTCGTTADWNFCFVDTTTLAPGASASMTAIVSTPTLTCSDSAVGGDVTITADPTGIVAEADETNNAAGVAITVEPPAC